MVNRQRSPGRMSWTSALKPGMTVRTEKAEGSAPLLAEVLKMLPSANRPT